MLVICTSSARTASCADQTSLNRLPMNSRVPMRVFGPVVSQPLLEVEADAQAVGLVQDPRLDEVDARPRQLGARLELKPERLPGAGEGVAGEQIREARGRVGDVEVPLLVGDAAQQARVAGDSRAERELRRAGFIHLNQQVAIGQFARRSIIRRDRRDRHAVKQAGGHDAVLPVLYLGRVVELPGVEPQLAKEHLVLGLLVALDDDAPGQERLAFGDVVDDGDLAGFLLEQPLVPGCAGSPGRDWGPGARR